MLLLDHFNELTLEYNNSNHLKDTVLDLAARGKLTQKWRKANPNVEPADQLLAQIQKEKQRLVNQKQIKKEKPLPPVSDEEKPFKLPEGWVWCRLNEVSQYIQRGKSPKYVESSAISIVSQKCVQWKAFDFNEAKFLDEKYFQSYSSERVLQPKDLLWNSTGDGTVGRVGLFPGTIHDFSVADSHVTVVRIFNNIILPEFLWIYTASPLIQNRVLGKVSGSTKQTELSTKVIKSLEFALPTVGEQKAIVSQVNQLFKEVEELKSLVQKRYNLKHDYADSALHQLANGNPSKEWQKLKPSFHTFFDQEDNIKKLRKTILQLGIQGKLTHKLRKANPDVEPADQLLERIQKEKQRLINQKQIKKEKPLPPVSEEEKP